MELTSVVAVSGDVLNESAAERHVHDLNTAADREDRSIGGQGRIHDGEFDVVVPCVDAVQLGCRGLLAVAHRIDVPATVQNECLTARDQRGNRRGIEIDRRHDHRNAAGPRDGIGVQAAGSVSLTANTFGFGDLATDDGDDGLHSIDSQRCRGVTVRRPRTRRRARLR